MLKKIKKSRLLAFIDIGSSLVRLTIAEISVKGKVQILEDLSKRTDFGRDSFSAGRISVASINNACETLNGFVKLMRDYRIKEYRAVATSGLREADNKEYVLDRILNRTGLVVEIINISQERFFIYKALSQNSPSFPELQISGVLVANIGSWGLGVSAYSEGSLRLREYFKAGSLRLWENLAEMEQITLEFSRVMEELLESQIYSIKEQTQMYHLRQVIGLGSEVLTIGRLCGGTSKPGQELSVSQDALLAFYQRIQKMPVDKLVEQFAMTRSEVETFLPSIIILNKMMELTGAEEVVISPVSMRHGLIADYVDNLFETAHKKYFQDDVILSVRYLGKKFGADGDHCEKVQHLALTIFDQTRKIHQLGERERFYLQVVAILHDIGRYISINQHQVHSYNLIKSSEIIGFSNRELEIMANVARYHSRDIPHYEHANYAQLSEKDKIVVSKLAGMMKLAESLDISHKQKISDLAIQRKGVILNFRVTTTAEALLEEWNFSRAAGFFEEVMGYRPVFKRK